MIFRSIRISLNKNTIPFKRVNLYFQDESRFGLNTFVGKCLSMKGLRPKVTYQHRFENTYLWGSYSPITGDQFVWEINGVDSLIFEHYLNEFSKVQPEEFKIIVLDNASFHCSKKIKIPKNIFLLNIPPYCPELNPCEQVWQYIKKRFKNKTLETLKQWLANRILNMKPYLIKSITGNHHYITPFIHTFKV